MLNKLKKATIIFTSAALSALPLGALAAENVKITTNEKSFAIEGSSTCKFVNTIIMAADTDEKTLTAKDTLAALSCEVSAGKFGKSMLLPDTFAEGVYKACVNDDDGLDIVYFVYGGSEYKNSFASEMINGGKLEEFMEKYAESYGADSDNFFALSENARAAVESRLKNVSITDFKAQYEAALGNARMSSLENNEQLLGLLKDVGADFSVYDGLSEQKKKNVLSKTFKNLPSDISELADVFEKNAVSEKNASSTVKGGSGGGGGGGSSYKPGGPSAGTSVAPAAPSAGSSENSDTSVILPDTAGHWARENILTLNKIGIISGYSDGNFYPENNITRAEFSKIIAGAFIMVSDKQAAFSDVSESDWFVGAVSALSGSNIINGYSDGSFKPNNLITRQEAAAVLYRICQMNEKNLENQTDFSDINDADEYAREALKRLGGAGIFTGSDGMVNPKTNLTRAEAAALICRLMNNI